MGPVENQAFVWVHPDGREVAVKSYAEALQMCAPFRNMVNGVVENMTEGLPEESKLEEARKIGESLFSTLINGQRSMRKNNDDSQKPVAETKTGDDSQKPVAETKTGDDPQKPVIDTITEHVARKPVAETITGVDAQKPVIEPIAEDDPQRSVIDTITGVDAQKPVIEPITGVDAQKPVIEPITGDDPQKPVTETITRDVKHIPSQPVDKPMQEQLPKVIEPKESSINPAEQPSSPLFASLQTIEVVAEKLAASVLEAPANTSQPKAIQEDLNIRAADFIIPAPEDVGFTSDNVQSPAPEADISQDMSMIGEPEALAVMSAESEFTAETNAFSISEEPFSELAAASIEPEVFDDTFIKLDSQDAVAETDINVAELNLDVPLGFVNEATEQFESALVCEELANDLMALVDAVNETSLAEKDDAATYDNELVDDFQEDIDTQYVAEVARALSELVEPDTQREVAELVSELSQAVLNNEESLLNDKTIEPEIYELTVKLLEMLDLDVDDISTNSFIKALAQIQPRPSEDYDISSVDLELDGTREANNRLKVTLAHQASFRQVLPLLIGALAILDSLRVALVA